MHDAQATLRRSSGWVEGPGLGIHGRRASLRFHPSDPDTGIRFQRRDLGDASLVRCSVENVRDQARWTSLEEAGVWVHHTEHLLAAVAGFRIDNVLVELTQDRIPVVRGGSADGFLSALATAGRCEQDAPRRTLRLTRALYVPSREASAAARYVLAVPDDVLTISYAYQLPPPDGGLTALAEFELGADDFARGVGRARTYYLARESTEVEPLLEGAGGEEFIVLRPDSPQPLVDEVARHKVLDFLGDLMILGQPVVGRFVAVRSGHRLHHDLVRRLSAGGLEPIDRPTGER